MLDHDVITVIRAHEAAERDRIPYTCQNPACGAVTYAPRGLVEFRCGHCRGVDLGTMQAIQQWSDKIKLRRALPAADAVAMLLGVAIYLAVSL